MASGSFKRLKFYEELVFDLLNVAAKGNDFMVLEVINRLKDQARQQIKEEKK